MTQRNIFNENLSRKSLLAHFLYQIYQAMQCWLPDYMCMLYSASFSYQWFCFIICSHEDAIKMTKSSGHYTVGYLWLLVSASIQTTSNSTHFLLYPTGPNSVVYINHLSTSTYPPSLSEGFSATYDLGLREPIDGDVDVKLNLKVKLGNLWITIPCVSQIGSW